MKVCEEGIFAFNRGNLLVTGWTFDMEGGPSPTDVQLASCALRYVADKYGLMPEQGGSFQVERAAANAIRNAKRAAKPPKARRKWAAWFQKKKEAA